MRCRFLGITGTALIGLTLGGCVQMTRHSNTLVFGTNTSFGVKVGADATSTPGITVGYSRQEAVVMPLVANTGGTADGLLPCPVGADQTVPSNCLLVGTNVEGERGRRDAYSVFASFGTKYGAKSGSPEANGQIAQYFATGVAAQRLAEAGPATVALGAASATASDPQVAAFRKVQVENSDKIAKKVEATAPDKLGELLDGFDKKADSDGSFRRACTGDNGALAPVSECAANIRARIGLRGLPAAKFEAVAN